MTAASDQALVRRFFEEVWNRNDLEVARDIVHEDYASPEGQTFPSLPGFDILAADLKLYQSLYRDLTFTIERMFVEEEQEQDQDQEQQQVVWTVWHATGESKIHTFTDRLGRIRPQELSALGVSLTEVRDGKVASHRLLWPRTHP
ncbi:ester cyclase [Streptomyces bambusae]|uniref:ester cyclase n=1 Tax=Streptomyces bambusae TaxID=1550616 RepID=UPI001CFEC846|nr:ester cyclase [Streptomyces bambusae]MCB5164408.1 ester cyclase [Streptomyces bambusae]